MNFTLQAILQSLSGVSAISILVVIAVAAGIAVWKIATWKKGVDDGLLGLRKLTKKVDEIHSVIVQSFGRSVTHADSPIKLTEFGAELATKIDADEIVNKYADSMQSKTNGQNAYQIQEECFEYCREELVDDLKKKFPDHFEKMSKVAFQDGLEMESLTKVVGIKLRDEVLFRADKTHAEVDKSSNQIDRR